MVFRKLSDSDAYPLALLSLFLSGLSLAGVLFWWAATPDNVREFDSFAWSMAALQTFLIIVALGGFWLIRGAAISAAEEAAREEAVKHATKVAREVARRWAREVTTELVPLQTGGHTADASSSSFDQSLMAALDSDENEGGEHEE